MVVPGFAEVATTGHHSPVGAPWHALQVSAEPVVIRSGQPEFSMPWLALSPWQLLAQRTGALIVAGKLLLGGEEITGQKANALVSKGIGYVPQEPAFFEEKTAPSERPAISRMICASGRCACPGC